MAVPPKGRPIRGPAAKRSSIADEPNTKYLSETLYRFVKLYHVKLYHACEQQVVHETPATLASSTAMPSTSTSTPQR